MVIKVSCAETLIDMPEADVSIGKVARDTDPYVEGTLSELLNIVRRKSRAKCSSLPKSILCRASCS